MMKRFNLTVAFMLGVVLTPRLHIAASEVVIGYANISARVSPLWIAQEQGLFQKYGIETQIVFVRTTSVHIAGLLSGHIDLSYGGGSGILPVAASGVDLKFIASFANRLSHLLVSRPEIQKPNNVTPFGCCPSAINRCCAARSRAATSTLLFLTARWQRNSDRKGSESLPTCTRQTSKR